jgi:predicted GNAT family N-acyltransferase
MSPVFLCKQIGFGTPAYDATVALRYDILRKPLGLTFTQEQLDNEVNDFHLAAYMDDEIIACLILTQSENGEIKMRQVAVKENKQGMGIGKKLVAFAETFAKEKGFTKMVLHARETAVPFYTALAYNTEGQPFTEVGLPHKKMYKLLAA